MKGPWTLPQGRARWASPPMFDIQRSRDELVASLGEPQYVDVDSNGTGLMDVWLVRFECGLEVAFWWLGSPPGVGPVPADVPTSIEVHANAPEQSHLLFHLDLTPDAVSFWEPNDGLPGENRWQVVRLDDNGNVFEVTRVTSRCEADFIAAEYERRGHKQTYSVEQAPG